MNKHRSNQNIVAGKYYLGPKVGSGSFGEVHICSVEDEEKLYAIKKEDEKVRMPQLHNEMKILKELVNITGFPQLSWFGVENKATYMVMELLGPSLQDLLFLCDKKFSLKTVLMLADQMIQRLEHLHSINYLHRDIKPENFLIGIGDNTHHLYLIDFGLSKKYRDLKTKQHIPYKENRKLVGTVRYSSINTHFGVEQSRRDDLESIGYVLLYLLKGSVPWQGFTANNKAEKYEKIQEKKMSIPVEIQCKNLPIEFATYLNYCRTLKFQDKPDYKFLRKLFRDVFDRLNFEWDYDYDWCHLENAKHIETNHLQIEIQKIGDELNFNSEEVKQEQIQLEVAKSVSEVSDQDFSASEDLEESSFESSKMNMLDRKGFKQRADICEASQLNSEND